MSRATISVPFRFRRVLIGYLLSSASTSSMGRSRSMSTAGANSGACSGRYLAGSFSSCSTKMPSSVIFALILRSALQLTPKPTGQEAAWRGKRTTRTSCTKYLPPNWAPISLSWQIFCTFSSHSKSRNAWPPSLPSVGRWS